MRGVRASVKSFWLLATLAAVSLVVLAFVFSPAAEGIVLSGAFVDDNGNTFESDIDAIAQKGITKGCNPPTNDRFCPTRSVSRGEMAAFLVRAFGLTEDDDREFVDVPSGSTFAVDISKLATAGITIGCNPPTNNRFCPNDPVTRGQMAAFIVRAEKLTANTHPGFVDVPSGSTFAEDIGRLATKGITRGCNPPTNNRFCPTRSVSRGEMAAFLRRTFNLPFAVLRIPMGHHNAMSCSKDGQRCQLTVDLSAGRPYRVQEGLFQANPASSSEQSAFNSSGTSFALILDGSNVSVNELSKQSGGGTTSRLWRRDITFSAGTHTLVGRWSWNGTVNQTTTIAIRASG